MRYRTGGCTKGLPVVSNAWGLLAECGSNAENPWVLLDALMYKRSIIYVDYCLKPVWVSCPKNLQLSLSSHSVLNVKFPQRTMWVGWVESNFRNPTVKYWANLVNPYKIINYTKFCMSLSLDGTLPESISQENNSPLTLYIDFHNFSWLWTSIIYKCMQYHLSPNISKYKGRRKIYFQWKVTFCENFVPFHNYRHLFCCSDL